MRVKRTPGAEKDGLVESVAVCAPRHSRESSVNGIFDARSVLLRVGASTTSIFDRSLPSFERSKNLDPIGAGAISMGVVSISPSFTRAAGDDEAVKAERSSVFLTE